MRGVCCAQVQRLLVCANQGCDRTSHLCVGAPCFLVYILCAVCAPSLLCFGQVSSIIRALKLGVSVLMLDMDTQPSKRALFPADTLPDADLVYVP